MNRNAKVSLKTNEEVIEYNISISLKNNKINYTENDLNNTNVLLDIDKKLLIRDNKELYLEYDFLNNKGLVYLKELCSSISLNLITINFLVENKKIDIKYKIDENNYQYFIEME